VTAFQRNCSTCDKIKSLGGARGQCNVREHVARGEIEGGFATQQNGES
jgi:hypothetical protein